MLSEELLKKVRLIEISTRRVVDDVMSGQYKSHFKGHGVQFSEHRIYVPGDDVRHIDWKVSARSREPLIKKFEEERELNVFLVVDMSGSQQFGSQKKLKSEVLAEVGGMLVYAASQTGDKVGALLFAGEVEKIIPPGKGRKHVLRMIREFLGFKAKTRGTNLVGALQSAGRIMKHGGIIFVLSDFISDTSGYEKEIKRLALRHDVVAVSIGDRLEENFPDIGRLLVHDPETGQEQFVDTGSYLFKRWMEEVRRGREEATQAAFRSNRIDRLRIETGEDYGEAVVRFFRARARRRK